MFIVNLIISFLFSLKKVQEKKKQARAIAEKRREQEIANGIIKPEEHEPRSILDEQRDEDVLF